MSKRKSWWPENPPIYNIDTSYLDNLENGPFFEGEYPKRELPPESQWHDFLGFKVASPLGVPAGPLLNANWVILAAKMGFDIVTYKTIRSRPQAAHPHPNMIYVETDGYLTPDRYSETLSQADKPPKDTVSLAATNSFGIPSMDREFLVKDIAKAQAGMGPGQVMIVSVVGTPREGEDFFEDFVEATKIAIDGGAQIIESDLSCPNVASAEGSLFTDAHAVYEISRRMKAVMGDIPLIIKVGVIDDKQVLRTIMQAAKRAGVEAICGINTVSMKVVKADGTPALGSEKRLRAGVCGGPIRLAALDFIEKAHAVNKEENLGLTIMATGGVTAPEHFAQFFEKGADVAMSAVGMMWDPYLAARYHECYS